MGYKVVEVEYLNSSTELQVNGKFLVLNVIKMIDRTTPLSGHYYPRISAHRLVWIYDPAKMEQLSDFWENKVKLSDVLTTGFLTASGLRLSILIYTWND